jgi:hypothetical protein
MLPLQSIEDVSVDQKQITLKILSRLRDLWEVSNGWVCLDDHYAAPVSQTEADTVAADEFAEGLGIKLGELALDEKLEEEEESAQVARKEIGEQITKRANIVKEIIDTEETYIRGLQELVDVRPSLTAANESYTLTIHRVRSRRSINSASSSVTSKPS